MYANTPSIEVAQARLLKFQPPYCANPSCNSHHPEDLQGQCPFQLHGVPRIKRFPYISPRFRCPKCRKTFSASFFNLAYRDRKPFAYEEIFADFVRGLSGRAIAARQKWSEDTIRRKKKRMARWALLQWASDLESLTLAESVAFDGLENFSFSQYEPNNLNHVVGRESLFIYDFNLSPMNRKGRTSQPQKVRKNYLDAVHGRFDGRAIEKDAQRVFERILKLSKGDLILHTDNHYAYRRAISQIADRHRLVHLITPSKVHRNYKNRLFAINHTDMLSRHHLSAFKRETIAFAKNTISMLESFALMATDKNYLRTQFTKRQVRNPMANLQSPAMALGIRTKVQSFREFFSNRISVHHVKLSEDWQDLFDSYDPSSRHHIRPYCGI